MLSSKDNEIVTRVGPDTPMGRTMRAYWLPALLSSEIPEPDCPPVRVRLLGEDLIAFRDSQGQVGLLDEFCPHRRASLYFGRNEECGLRCVYHGWKFSVAGACVDMMNEPEEHDFKHKVRITAYSTAELGGIVWAYLGPAERMPPLPKFAWTGQPDTHRHVTKVVQECNWLQGLEGGIDTSHAPIMHRLLSETSTRGGFRPSNPFVRGKAPTLAVDITDYGFCYAGIRPLGEAEQHIRFYQFILPFHQIRPSKTETGAPADAGHAWVPMDDGRTMVFNWVSSRSDAPLGEEDRLERSLGNGPLHVDPLTFRSHANRENDYLLDRSVQRSESFTGIDGINVQDRAIQESMGRIVDRSKEHLGPADKAIIEARKLLREAVNAVEAGNAPPGSGPSYYTLHAAEAILPRAADWRRAIASATAKPASAPAPEPASVK
ncbi:MAG: Rieske 2Fe-2S domain-containing protein [Acetobacteraceae bacterium]|nr:Rieske 2Fe-2S domain-containing protein [Acetobacteraceae bacterium]